MSSSLEQAALALRDGGLLAVDRLATIGMNGGDRITSRSGTANRILLIRLDAIGDFVVGLDAMQGLREHHADAEITLVGNVLWADLAEHVPYVDHIISVDPYRFRHSLSYRYDRLRHLTKGPYRVAIHLAHRRSGRFADADAIMRAVEAERKVASCGDAESDWRVHWSNRWYTDVVMVDRDEMELRRNAQLVRALGVRDFQAGLPTLPQEELPVLEGLPDAYYVLFPGAGADQRRWPPTRFAEVAKRLESETGWTGIICGGPGEEILGQQIRQMTEANVRNWVGRTSIPGLGSVIAGANLLVSNETSAVHLATAVSTPSVCVLGGGHHGRFAPYDVEQRPAGRPTPRSAVHKMPCFNCGWNCCFEVPDGAPAPCVDRIPTDVVWSQVQDILAEIAGETPTGLDDP